MKKWLLALAFLIPVPAFAQIIDYSGSSVTLLTVGADGDSTTTDSDSGLELIGGKLTLIRGCADNEVMKWDETADDWNCAADASGGGGTPNILDLGDDAANESADLIEIATTGDTNSIFTEPSADKLLIAVGNDWPKADDADDVTCVGCVADAELATDFISETELDTEAELETQLTDVANMIIETEIDTSGELGAIVTDETGGGGALVFAATPTLVGVTITAHSTVQDDLLWRFGTSNDWTIEYDEGVDDQLLIFTSNTAATAITDPMLEILVGATPTADQEVFGVAKGTQASNTPLLTLDEDGDGVFAGTLAASNLSGTNTGDDATDYISEAELDTEAELETQITDVANFLTEVEIDASSELLALMDDETGTGVLVFGTAPTFTTEITLTPVATPTTDADGEIAIDIDGWGTGFDAIEFFNSTASAYVVATTASDTPTNGQVPKWNTGGSITWEDDTTGGAGVWTDADPVLLATTTREVEVGPTLAGAAKFTIHGDADEAQLFIQGNGTQTTNLITVEDSAATDVLTLTNAGVLDATTITEGGNAVPNVTDHLGVFGGTTSAQLLAELSDETGTGVAVFGTAPTFTTEITLTPVATPTTDADGEIAIDIDGWGTGFDAIEFFNSTASAYIVATTASDTPTNGQVAKWNTGGSITWEDDTTGGAGVWTDADPVLLATTGREVEVGATLAGAAKFTIHGDADEPQLFIQGNGTQTNNLVTIENSAATDLLTLTNAGVLDVTTLTEGGNAVPNVTDHLGVFGGTTSAQLLAELSDETGTGVAVFGTSPTFTTGLTTPLAIVDLIDATGAVDIDIGSADITDVTFTTDGTGTVVLDGTSSTINGNAIADASDHLGFFAATTSAQLAGVVSDETGTGVAVFGTAPTFTTEITLTPVATPTTDADGEIAIDIDAWGTGFDAIEFFNSTASAYVVATTASDSPSDGQVPKWNTGGSITWEDDSGAAGSVWTDGGAGGPITVTTANTDDVVIGGGAAIGGALLTVDGNEDEIQLLVQSHSSQTADTFVVESSSGINILSTNGIDVYVGEAASTSPHELHVFDGATDNEPGALTLYEDDGTAHYIFFRSDGTLAEHSAYPTDDDTDGNAIDTNSIKVHHFTAAALGSSETAFGALELHDGTNQDRLFRAFDPDTDECNESSVKVPDDLASSGNVTIRLWSTGDNTSDASGVAVYWSFRYVGRADAETIDQAYTDNIFDAETFISLDSTTIFMTTDTIAVASFTAGDLLLFKICRDANNASDTYDGDARLFAGQIEFPRE